ncbi:MAG: SDR family oxidoreductase [Pontixanthobacter sp.]
MKFGGRLAVITGGASGIGLALAHELGRAGSSVLIADQSQSAIDSALAKLSEAGVNADGAVCDVTNPESVDALAEQAFGWKGRVDLLINNAGVSQKRAKLHEADLRDVRHVMDVNFWGVWHGCAAFAPRMAQQDHPSAIYNVGSENSLYCAVPRAAAYIASKHAIIGLTDSFREDLPDHVHVGTIMPGWVATGLTPSEVAHLAMSAEEFARIIVPQILARERYVVSHSYNAVRNAERHGAIADCYARNVPRYDGDERYDVRILIDRQRNSK